MAAVLTCAAWRRIALRYEGRQCIEVVRARSGCNEWKSRELDPGPITCGRRQHCFKLS